MGNCISYCIEHYIGHAWDVSVLPSISQYPKINLNHTKINTIL